jgi:HD-GYP domain-containing protein (c-di-GMP phosphodiesterase class II)
MAQAIDLPQEEIEVIASAGLLHDPGKVGMADDILFKDKKLDPSERASAERHAEIGAMLLNKFPLFAKGANLVRHHHEHYDGNGYPDHLKGEAIPIGARIIAIADAFQAMTAERPYRHAMGQEAAIAELQRCSGTQFDPNLVKTFIEILRSSPAPAPQPAAALPVQAD